MPLNRKVFVGRVAMPPDNNYAGCCLGQNPTYILCLLAAIVIFNSCGMRPGEDTLAIGIAQTIPTMDPAMHRDRVTESVHRNMFDGLVTRDRNMQVVPELAESWYLVDDRRWEFRLRQGIQWHNGDPFTAPDVKFTLERVMLPTRIDGRSSPRKGLLGPLETVEVIDDYTVQLVTSEPWPTLLAMLPFHEMVPKTYIEEVGDAYFAEHPVGTGPFRFVEWRKGEHIIMERFHDYYGGAPDIPPVGTAHIERLIFRPIPETATRVAALKAGECGLIQLLPPHLIDNVISDRRTRILSCAGTKSYYVGMNCLRSPFDDLRVRQAMNYAVDMESIVETILEGAAIVLPGPLVPDAFGHDPLLSLYQQNIEKAHELLAEAGVSDDIAFELDCTQDTKEVATAIAAQLKKVGVKAKVRVWEWGVLRSELEKQSRTCFMSDWGNASLDPVGILNPTLHTGGRGNYTGYSDPEVDRLLDEAMVTMDTEKRRRLYREAERIIHTNSPWIFGYSMKEIYAARNEIRNWTPTPDGRMNMHDVVFVFTETDTIK